MVKVQIIESESDWGARVDSVKEFDTVEEAEKFVREYNSKYNPPGPTPSWYMFANIEGRSMDEGMMR